MIVHMVPGSNTKPAEENIGMFETAVMVAVVDVLCNSLMLEEHNIYLLLKTRHTNTHSKLGHEFRKVTPVSGSHGMPLNI